MADFPGQENQLSRIFPDFRVVIIKEETTKMGDFSGLFSNRFHPDSIHP
jgi:hypothetical protein